MNSQKLIEKVSRGIERIKKADNGVRTFADFEVKIDTIPDVTLFENWFYESYGTPHTLKMERCSRGLWTIIIRW